MHGVVTHGTAHARATCRTTSSSGKTGTTENYGDAWFVGFDTHYTVAVWVGYPDKLIPMKTQYRGGSRWRAAPTRPRSGTTSWSRRLNILNTRNPKKNKLHFTPGTTGATSAATSPSGASGGSGAGTQGGQQSQGKSKTQHQPTGGGNQNGQAPSQQTPPRSRRPPRATGPAAPARAARRRVPEPPRATGRRRQASQRSAARGPQSVIRDP